jgi:hypothetical protein
MTKKTGHKIQGKNYPPEMSVKNNYPGPGHYEDAKSNHTPKFTISGKNALDFILKE